MAAVTPDKQLLTLADAAVGYGSHPLFHGLSLAIGKGDFVAFVGPNGGGKTTVLNTLLGLLPPLGGSVQRAADLAVGYVPQRGRHDPIFPLLAIDVVRAGGRRPGRGIAHWPILLASVPEALRALAAVGMEALADRPFATLSGGQQQRVLMARALVREPDLLALDEPTVGMDLPAERELLDLVSMLARERSMAVVLVTHQLWLAARYSRTTVLINHELGLFTVDRTEELLQADRLSAIFGHPMEVVTAGDDRFVRALPGREVAS